MNKLLPNPILYFFILVLFSTCSKEEKEIKFNLSTSINPDLGGSVDPSGGSFDSGEEIILTAKPSKGFKFKSWGGDFSSETNPLLLKINSDKKIIVNFELADTDGDGVYDNEDDCDNTPEGETADANGCSTSQVDTDGDGVNDDIDVCPSTPSGETVDANGCSTSQVDSDNDGINDDVDQCTDTPEGESVDTNGCSTSQVDSDNDGINDDVDQCDNTPEGETVDANGCTVGDLDGDGDGIENEKDLCPGTPSGETVDTNGCSESQRDTDVDGVNDDVDVCPITPSGETVDANGCSESQKDTDGDGVNDDVDVCPSTPSGETVDANGCSESQKDTDGDGVNDDVDVCPSTPSGETVDANGCEVIALSFIPDDGFEQFLIDKGYDDVLDDYVITANINTIGELYILDLSVADYGITQLTGIEDFTSLKKLTIIGTSIEILNINDHPSLEELIIEFSGSVNLFRNPKLLTVYSRFGGGDFLSIKDNLKLKGVNSFDATYNSLIINNNPEFTGFGGVNLNVSNIDISNNFAFSTITVSSITNLTSLKIQSDTLTSLDVSQNNNLEVLEVYSPLTCIKVNETQLNNIPPRWLNTSILALDCP